MFDLPDAADTIVKKWNEFAERNKLSKVKAITDTRIKHINQKLKHKNFNFDIILTEIQNSDFLLGKTKNSYWKVSFDWIFEFKNNWAKIINGNYRNEQPTNSAGTNGNKSAAEIIQQIKSKRQ